MDVHKALKGYGMTARGKGYGIGNGNSFYGVVGEKTGKKGSDVRRRMIQELRGSEEYRVNVIGDYDLYCSQHAREGTAADPVTIQATARALKTDIHLITADDGALIVSPIVGESKSKKQPIHVAFDGRAYLNATEPFNVNVLKKAMQQFKLPRVGIPTSDGEAKAWRGPNSKPPRKEPQAKKCWLLEQGQFDLPFIEWEELVAGKDGIAIATEVNVEEAEKMTWDGNKAVLLKRNGKGRYEHDVVLKAAGEYSNRTMFLHVLSGKSSRSQKKQKHGGY
eukprot:TRINITY_DN363_c0_g3_i2.p1 TRINITY_DN363_c0_g3~~TRINITY_DN363_c0_g3_i2.p1  ORF type:complete len:278 (+),score=67.89 TRINITY_DN363_c0_g3_i2:230-1063(+)